MQDFKQIKAWQRARAFGVVLHKGTRHFSRNDATNLRSQLNRAAESVASTIVEGCGAATNKEFARYLDIAIKSANETEHHLLDAHDYGLISDETWRRWTAEIVEIRKMTFGYRKKVLDSDRRSDAEIRPPRRPPKASAAPPPTAPPPTAPPPTARPHTARPPTARPPTARPPTARPHTASPSQLKPAASSLDAGLALPVAMPNQRETLKP